MMFRDRHWREAWRAAARLAASGVAASSVAASVAAGIAAPGAAAFGVAHAGVAVAGAPPSDARAADKARPDAMCLKPGLPLTDDPDPRMMRAGRAQLDAYVACMRPELDRLRRAAAGQEGTGAGYDAALAEIERITEQWRSFEERVRNRRRR